MFLNKVFHFVRGYVIINISGFYIERFLYICARQGIELFKIGKRTSSGVIVCIDIKDYKKIRPIVFETRVKVSILKKYGLPFLFEKAKKRRALFFGILILSLLSFAASNFIWAVEIKSGDNGVGSELMEAVEAAGVRIGAYKPFLPDGEKIKSIIMNNTDNLVWAWVYINGTKAVVDFKEGIPAPDMLDRRLPCNIVAQSDGVVAEIVEKNGVSAVNCGDSVARGDILISGAVEHSDGNVRALHAIGDVYARVWHEKSGDYKLYIENEMPTGNKKDFVTVKLFSRCFDLFRSESVGYADYSISERLYLPELGKNNFLGFGFYKKTYSELERKKICISEEEALELARHDLEMQISKELLPGSVLNNKSVACERIDDETLHVTLTMEFTEQIGIEKPFM